MVKRYRTKPCEIEAVQFTNDNFKEIVAFTNGEAHNCCKGMVDGKAYCDIITLEGIMTATEGDYIIKGLRGEHYPCKPDVFEKKYEEIK